MTDDSKFGIRVKSRPGGWRVCDTKVGVLPLVHDIFVKAYGGSSRVVRGARLAGDRT